MHFFHASETHKLVAMLRMTGVRMMDGRTHNNGILSEK
jgi:hypothetical protein